MVRSEKAVSHLLKFRRTVVCSAAAGLGSNVR
jgi:hypothetical protein